MKITVKNYIPNNVVFNILKNLKVFYYFQIAIAQNTSNTTNTTINNNASYIENRHIHVNRADILNVFFIFFLMGAIVVMIRHAKKQTENQVIRMVNFDATFRGSSMNIGNHRRRSIHLPIENLRRIPRDFDYQSFTQMPSPLDRSTSTPNLPSQISTPDLMRERHIPDLL